MSVTMTFPNTWEEYEKLYGFNDSEEIYTNNSRLIPSFRVKQWLDHIAQKENKQQAIKASDYIYRQQALDTIRNIKAITGTFDDEILLIDKAEAQTELMMLPSAEPERKKGKWIDDGDPLTFKCDKCGYLVARYNNTNFCPNCGSYNGGEQDED